MAKKYQQELALVMEKWNERRNKLIQEFVEKESAIKQSQQEELSLYQEYLESTISLERKPSTNLLALQNRIKNEVRLQDYGEAQKDLVQACQLLNANQCTYAQQRAKRIKSLVESRNQLHKKSLMV